MTDSPMARFNRVHVRAGRTELVELYPETMLEFSQVRKTPCRPRSWANFSLS